ncbi:MAG: hypothetical protein D8H98_10675 [Prevotella sp.]|nr:MAG: hypothetical protein D8H98_10675 [Prevotella sp.]
MRKLLLVCLTLLLHLTATAQDWTVNNNKYPNKTTVYMKIDGLVIGHSYDVGAFIDGVCRGITTNSVFVNQDGTTGCFGMDLWGTAADRGKTITFKVRRVGATSPSNTVYTINKTLSYTGSQQGSPDNGIAFNIILPVNISLPIPIEIGVGEKTPLRPLIKVTPANATLPDVLEWDFSNFSSYINVTNDILTGMSQAREAYLGLHAGNLSTYSFVRVIQRIKSIKVRPGKETISVAPRDVNKLASELHNAFIIEPENHEEYIEYVSSNPSVVQVDANNYCHPIETGTAIVTAIVYNRDGSPRIQASVKVKVGVPAQRIEINYPTAFYANAGDDIYPRLKAVTKVLPDNATSKQLAWTCNNPNVEVKTANGEVKAIVVKKAGRYMLNATLNDEYNQTGQQLSASIPINVQNPVKDIAIKEDMNFTFTTLNNNPIDIKPNVSLVPADGDPISVSFTSGGRSVVGTGLWDGQGMRADFVAKAYGQDVITANVNYSDYTNYLGTGNVPHRTVTRTFKVNISRAQTLITTIKVRPGKETITVAPRDDNKLASELHNAFIIEPANHTEQVRYTSSNPSVVQVDANNSCIPLQVGTATVTATVYNSNGSPRLQASVKVKVGVPAQRIEINYPTAFYANAGDDIYPRLKAVTKVLPDNATSKQLAWTCNNPNVEVKTANGEVKAIVVKKAGRYMLNATLNDEYNQTGQQLSASIPINVQNPVKDIAIKEDMNFTFTTLNNNPIDIKPNVSLVPADGDPISVSFTSGGRSVVGTGLWDGQGMRADFVAKAYGQDVITANVNYSDYTNYLGTGNVPHRTVTRTFKVNIRQGALNISVTCEPLVVGREAQVTLTAQPAGTQLDLTKVNVTLTATGGQYPTSWPLCEVRHTSNKVSVTPKLPGAVVRKVFYEGLEVSSDNDNVAMPVSFARGWQWRTFCGKVSPTNFNAVLGTHVEEIRAQESLLRYDSQQGFFGQIAEEGIKAQTCYMVKTADNYAPLPNAKLDNTLTDSRTAYTQELSQGWNWIGNPYFFDRALNNVLRHAPNFTIVKGDRIVSKNNGFAEYDGTRWRGTLAVLKAGEGLLYYSQDFKTLTWQAESTMPAINATAGAKYNAEQEEPQWAYDHTLFENNASVVASITNSNTYADYRVGAFVGNECRGEGRCIDGKLFITVHSKMGETIRFVLFDTRTGALYHVPQTTLARPLVGGLTNPLPLSLGAGTTGVGMVHNDDVNAEVFNLQGQRIAKPQRGVNIIRDKNGKTRKEMKR